LQILQDFVGVGANVGHGVDLGNLAFRIDKEGGALGKIRVLLVRASLDSIGPTNGTIGVGQQVESELLRLGEGFVVGGRIKTGAENLGTDS
jgi:hypothetical protein